MGNGPWDDEIKELVDFIWHCADEFHNGSLLGKQASSEIWAVVEELYADKARLDFSDKDQPSVNEGETLREAIDRHMFIQKPGEPWLLRKKGEAMREEFAEGREHLTVTDQFQSDKYDWCPVGFVPLKLTDPDARKVLKDYAEMHRNRDSEFSRDLLEAIEKAGDAAESVA